MKIALSSGHGRHIRGATGIIEEVFEARRVTERVDHYLRAKNVEVVTFHDNESQTQSENLAAITDWSNQTGADLAVSIHFNAYEPTDEGMGTEVLYVTQRDLAEKVSEAIAEAGDLIDRGPKQRGDLYFLNQTDMPAILIEVCFVDSTEDTTNYQQKFDVICEAIADVLADAEALIA